MLTRCPAYSSAAAQEEGGSTAGHVPAWQAFWINLDSHLERHQRHTPDPCPNCWMMYRQHFGAACRRIPQHTLLLLQHLPPWGSVCARAAASGFSSKLSLQSLCFFFPSHRCSILTAQRAVDQACDSVGASANKEIVMAVRFLWVERSHLQPPMNWHDKLFIFVFLSFNIDIQNMNVL